MTTISAKWTNLAAVEQLKRSSHNVTTIGSSIYIFGGELKPREPRDNDLHKVEVRGSYSAVVETVKATDKAPQPRVGAAATKIGNTMYMFSGRGGPAMAPVDEKGALWSLDASSNCWSLIEPTSGTFPAARSYHCMASDGEDTVFMHAGCPEKGRLGDLWAFSLSKREWKELAPAPDPPRGGTSIAFAEGKIWRIGGFDGTTEQGGSLDNYDPQSNSWSSITYKPDGKQGPGARSVAALVPVQIDGSTSLVTLFGESDPSSLGHQGAGKMLSDLWAFSIEHHQWSQIIAEVEGMAPDARAWFDADVIEIDGHDSIVVSGGLGETNERLNDLWLLTFQPQAAVIGRGQKTDIDRPVASRMSDLRYSTYELSFRLIGLEQHSQYF